MLHKETVTAGTLDLIHRLMADEHLQDFNLVGGTALALMLGHRISIDIDLFTDKEFNGDQLRSHLDHYYKAEFKSVRDNAITGFIEDVKFDLILHPYQKIMPSIKPEGIRMESLFDIAAMKINAIVGNGSRIKDFIDIHYLFKVLSCEQIINSYLKKYPDVYQEQAILSLRYHQDIDFTTAVTLIDGELKWKEIEKSILNGVAAFERTNKQKLGKRESGPKL
jgi:Nucleotidyl transferase AbiEii toxin, Type IV TA system